METKTRVGAKPQVITPRMEKFFKKVAEAKAIFDEEQKSLSATNIPALAEVQAVYSTKVKADDRPKITSSTDASRLLRPLFQNHIEYREAFWVLYLNRGNQVLGAHLIGIGGIGSTTADAKIIFQGALLAHACSIILCHNHPSGNIRPSEPDIQLTKKLKEGGKLLDITILDHLILTDSKHYSFADEGML